MPDARSQKPEVRSQTSALRHPSSDFPRAHAIAPAHFELRDDGTIGAPASGTARSEKNVPAVLEAGAPTPEARNQTSALRPPASDFPHTHAHFHRPIHVVGRRDDKK